jgi:hypothetical protein
MEMGILMIFNDRGYHHIRHIADMKDLADGVIFSKELSCYRIRHNGRVRLFQG